ncbi:MAG: iron-sulfur cluster biosynthesis transcriptional regulator SufR [cyanobacterium endosymbiont of Rhopalodia musculus]|uniref:iron-sulfur cluster biosynthesis transcriptional regulator SufR n=1 Tax=cyanobacterium endosymbiont of Epithemia clementina EcSB TaxID=3034674 RepID=UPI00247FC35B|nr:iron-sulfur cluster biosynthesis transcriptional regulator SufR [cyanobacterium endosymbiont of Epithemia clementina EcSB]WGT67317.1 iron-sulfur cluster biosynthesis transcriptional regulator SufR [cyanobacterium endosymbiont of Epithemia clementina EcSB]
MTIIHPPSTKEDILNYLLKHGQAKASELAQALAITPQATRRHLKDLETEDLIEHQSQQVGLGRPQHIYYLSKQGRDHFPTRYGEFAVSFLKTLTETVGEQQVGEVLRKQWERKAEDYRQRIGNGPLEERVSKLVKLRQEEGYMAEIHLFNPKNSCQSLKKRYILAEHHCAISEVAESYPTVCGHELEMFAEILPDCTVERTHWINEGEHNCGYFIQAN